MTHSFTVFIDESGDEGFLKFREAGARGGASRRLVIGACITRTSRELELVGLRDRIKQDCHFTAKGKAIHFVDFNHSQRRKACQLIAHEPLRFAAVIGAKEELNPDNFKQKNSLYFYFTRYLIERVSWLCRDYRSIVKEGDGRANIVFSRRGGMSYDGFRTYLLRLKQSEDTRIHWPSLDLDAISAADHSRLAGLQIADFGVGAIAASIEPDRLGMVETAYIETISKLLYAHKGEVVSYGLKFLPNQSDLMTLQPETITFLQNLQKKSGQPPGP